jgi:hypothetical protein
MIEGPVTRNVKAGLANYESDPQRRRRPQSSPPRLETSRRKEATPPIFAPAARAVQARRSSDAIIAPAAGGVQAKGGASHRLLQTELARGSRQGIGIPTGEVLPHVSSKNRDICTGSQIEKQVFGYLPVLRPVRANMQNRERRSRCISNHNGRIKLRNQTEKPKAIEISMPNVYE